MALSGIRRTPGAGGGVARSLEPGPARSARRRLYLHLVTTRRIILTALTAVATLAPSSALALTTPAATPKEGGVLPKLLTSRELWATIDVCNPSNQPDTVGIRGSMPGDGHARDRLFMSFGLQYEAAGSTTWVDLTTSGASTDFLAVGAAKTAGRQDGTSFVIKPVAGKPPFTLRGVVDFQWRRGTRVLERASRPTTVGHESLAGADPKGYSAATCLTG